MQGSLGRRAPAQGPLLVGGASASRLGRGGGTISTISTISTSQSATGTPGVAASIAAQSCMYGTNAAAHATDGHVAGRSQLACKKRR